MARFQGKNILFRNTQRAIFGDNEDSHIEWDEVGNQLEISTVVSGVTPSDSHHLATKYYIDYTVTTVSGDIISQIPDTSEFLTAAEITTISGDIVDQIPTDYVSESGMTTISGDIIAQIPSLVGYATEVYVTTVSGNIVAQIPTDYYTTGEIDTISGSLNDKFSSYYTTIQVDTISGALNNSLNTHKTSDDHDGRYYTETEVNTISGNITAQLHTRSHTMTSTSDHSAGTHKVFYSDGSGNVDELSLGASGTCLTSNGADAAPIFAYPMGVPDINDQTGSGWIVSSTVSGNAYGFGAALYKDSDGGFYLSSAGSDDAVPCRALALEDGTGNKNVLLMGFVRNDDWSWDVGGDIYVSTISGGLTQTVVSGTGSVVQKVGFAWSSSVVLFNPGDWTIIKRI